MSHMFVTEIPFIISYSTSITMLSSRPQTILYSEPGSSENGAQVTSVKTIKTPSARRRVFGDISNRKTAPNTILTKRGINVIASSVKQQSRISNLKKNTPLKEHHFPGNTPKTAFKCLSIPPVDDVELPSGRSFNPFECEGDEVDISIDLESPPTHSHKTLSPQSWRIRALNLDECPRNTNIIDWKSPCDGSIDLSLEDEVDALGMIFNDISL
jgi:hypothetical protein